LPRFIGGDNNSKLVQCYNGVWANAYSDHQRVSINRRCRPTGLPLWKVSL